MPDKNQEPQEKSVPVKDSKPNGLGIVGKEAEFTNNETKTAMDVTVYHDPGLLIRSDQVLLNDNTSTTAFTPIVSVEKFEQLWGNAFHTNRYEVNDGKIDGHKATSEKVVNATLNAMARAFADGKLTETEAKEITALKTMILKDIEDNTLGALDEKEIIAQAAKIAPAEGFTKPTGGKGK